MVEGAIDSARTTERPPAATRRRRRRWWLRLWVIAPLLFLVMLGIARIVYWRTSIAYAPMKLHGTARPALGQPVHVRSTASRLAITGPAGTEQLLEFTLVNTGIHPLDINAVSAGDDAVVDVRWAANFVENGRRIPSPSHALPAHVPGHAVLNLQLVVRKPSCGPGERRYLDADVVIHWHALISPHNTRMNLLPGRPAAVDLCGPR
jgi:hypothetical protein